jgi:TRAP-type C4-dicarboxylate transport system substrate-binding protein
MKKLGIGALILLVLILMITPLMSACSTPTTTAPATTTAPTSAAKAVLLRFGTPTPPEHPAMKFYNDWAATFNSKAGGKYEMKVYAGGSLGSTLDQMNAIRTKAIDLGDAATNFYAPDDAAFDVMDVPFLFKSHDAQIEFTNNMMPTWDKISQAKFNQKLIAPFVYGHKDVYTVNKPVKVLEDWKGLLVSMNTNIESNTIKALGAAPVVIDWADELPSLQKGLITAGTLSSLSGLAPMKYADICKNYTFAYMKGGAGVIGINLDIWKAMPKDIQDMMLSTGKEAFLAQSNYFKAGEQGEWFQGIKDQGMAVYTLPSSERTRWIDATKSVADGYWAGLPSDIATQMKQYATDANNKYPGDFK